jgi:hypothetical protein
MIGFCFNWQIVLPNVNRASFSKMTNDLMHGLFSEQYMASHSVAGGNKDKQPLPANIVNRLIGKFANLFYMGIIFI